MAVAESFVHPDVRDEVSQEEWDLRVNLAAAYRAVATFGWDDLIFTHISARIPDTDHHFLINPYGLLFEEITASSLVKIDLKGMPVIPTDYFINPAGFVIHSAVHEAREDARCVMHLHTAQGQAVSAQKEGLMPLTQIAMIVREDVSYHEYEGIALDSSEKERLVADLGIKNAMILWNHGTLTIGETVGAAFMKMYALERACMAQTVALAGNVGLHMPSEKARMNTADQARGTAAGPVVQMGWDAVRRRLDRENPGYDR